MMTQASLSFYGTKSPQRVWDYLVIGSGMGGMTAATLLAKMGKRVLVLEQHYIPGGMTHSFKRHGWVWDAGVHAVGEVSQHSIDGRILNALTEGRLEWASLGEVYDRFHFPGGAVVDFPDSPQAFKANLIEAFPQERAAIERYFQEIRATVKTMRGHFLGRLMPVWLENLLRPLIASQSQTVFSRTTKAFLDSLTDNEKLKTVLAGQWGYYGLPPSKSSLAIHAACTNHFMHGAYYPVGGSHQIAEAMLTTVARNGGWTRTKAEVETLLMHNGRVQGVRLKNGEEIRAHRVISAAGAPTTFGRLVPEADRRQDWLQSVTRLGTSPAYVCLNLGFKGDIRQAGAQATNQWFYESWDAEKDTWDVRDPHAEAPVLYVSFPSLKDPTHDPGPEMKHTGEVVTFVPYEAFAEWQGTRWKKRGDDYEAFKQDLADRLLRQLYRHMPELEKHVAFVELATPLSTEHFVRAHKGAIYGLTPSLERYQNPWLRPRTPFKGLYLAGCDVVGGGVMGAFIGGVMAVAAAEPWKLIQFLRRLPKEMLKASKETELRPDLSVNHVDEGKGEAGLAPLVGGGTGVHHP